jgi:hypothetical protein
MKRHLSLAICLGVCSLLKSYALQLRDFAGCEPRFEPEKFFAGETRSWGVFENRAGNPSQRFTTSASGHREGESLVLHQTFTYENGRKQDRTWRIRRLDAHHYQATANDVVGIAKGEAYGNVFYLEYTVALKPGNPFFNVRLQQWMYGQDHGAAMVNSAKIAKLGVTLATVTEYFRH